MMPKIPTNPLNDKYTSVDLYSLLLFALYKLHNSEKYGVLSELIYILDKDSFIDLCKYFGGSTIDIPTLTQLEELVDALAVYERVQFTGVSVQEAAKGLGIYGTGHWINVKQCYKELKKVLQEYSFEHRENTNDEK